MAILAIIRAVILILSMTLYLLLYGITRIFLPHTKESAFWLRRFWIKTIAVPVLNIKIEVSGKVTENGALYICNHRSFIDPVIICKYLDAYIIAKAEIADYPLINKGAEVTGILWVKRESKDSRAATRKAYVDTISSGANVLVYPEGTVSVDKSPLPFKKGTFMEAAKNDFKVVPVALEYKDESDLWTISNLLKFYLRQAGKWSIRAKLSFGPVLSSTDGEELHKMASDWVFGEVARLQEGWSHFTD